MPSIENQLDRLENRLDVISDKLDTQNYGTLQLIHAIDKRVESHASFFAFAKWVVPSGGLLALISCMVSLFRHWRNRCYP